MAGFPMKASYHNQSRVEICTAEMQCKDLDRGS